MQLYGVSALIMDQIFGLPSFFLAMSELCLPCVKLLCLFISSVNSSQDFPILDLIVFLQGLVQQKYYNIYYSILSARNQPRHHV